MRTSQARTVKRSDFGGGVATLNQNNEMQSSASKTGAMRSRMSRREKSKDAELSFSLARVAAGFKDKRSVPESASFSTRSKPNARSCDAICSARSGDFVSTIKVSEIGRA